MWSPKRATFVKKPECSNGIRDLGINPQLLLGSKRTLN
jgi:hypothetical protein